MLAVQNLTHTGIFMTASVIRQLGVKPENLFSFSTPVSRLLYANIGRVLSQEANLYADIQMCHPGSLKMLDACIDTLRRFRDMVAAGDKGLFISEFEENRKYLGESFFDDSSIIFQSCMNTPTQKRK